MHFTEGLILKYTEITPHGLHRPWRLVQAKDKYTYNLEYALLLIRLIPQGTVDNNIGPDHLAGPKALDPN